LLLDVHRRTWCAEPTAQPVYEDNWNRVANNLKSAAEKFAEATTELQKLIRAKWPAFTASYGRQRYDVLVATA
jgi:hypothetical protein